MSLERFSLLRDPVVDLRVAREPAWPENRVIQIGLLDRRRGIPIGIENAAISFARDFAVDAHRADEDQPLQAVRVHSVDDRAGLLDHVAGKIRVDDVLPPAWRRPESLDRAHRPRRCARDPAPDFSAGRLAADRGSAPHRSVQGKPSSCCARARRWRRG